MLLFLSPFLILIPLPPSSASPPHAIFVRLQRRQFHRKFVWHRHEDTDEAFLVINGEVRIDFRHGHVDLRPGDLFVVGRCVEHRPTSKCGADVLLIVPKGISNTGTVGGQLTAAANNWI